MGDVTEQALEILAQFEENARANRVLEEAVRAAGLGESWARFEKSERRRVEGACPCECNRGEFCGGCGHRGCGRR